jgi:hypothetical protein
LKHTGPLLGYNNNVPYKGNVYHVQTEDSGSKRPHVITHLFADGGRIVKTKKTSYAHFVESENLTERVRALMRDQHKGIIISLRVGELDHLIDPAGTEPHVVARDMVETGELAPTASLEVVEKPSIQDERDFRREMEELAALQASEQLAAQKRAASAPRPPQPPPLPPPPPHAPAPPPPAPASPALTPPPAAPPPAAHSAGEPLDPGSPSPETTYSFVGRPSGPPRRGGSGPPDRSSPPPMSRTPRSSSRPGGERAARSHDYGTDPAHPVRFGERWTSNKRFDEVVVEFFQAASR